MTKKQNLPADDTIATVLDGVKDPLEHVRRDHRLNCQLP